MSAISETVDPRDLIDIFGFYDAELSVEEHARASTQRFVRTHTDLSFWSEGEGGLVLTAAQAREAFGWTVLRELLDRVTVPLIHRGCQVGPVLRERREEVQISVQQLARTTGLQVADIEAAEAGRRSMPMTVLTRLARALALDPLRIGFVENGGGDVSLGVRMRELQKVPTASLSPTLVLGLLEAAWVIGEQSRLEAQLDASRSRAITRLGFRPRALRDVAWPPAWQQGADLAHETRRLLGYEAEEPIHALLPEVEDRLAIPVVPLRMPVNFAGATIENGGTRGIVVNLNGINANVWTRRMTVAHELGHLLWDPSDDLARLRVNRYSDLTANAQSLTDLVEMRVNAFAAELLAPKAAVTRKYFEYGGGSEAVSRLTEEYGVSITALSWQLHNGSDGRIQQSRVRGVPNTKPSEKWRIDENRRTDFFVFDETPISRTGRFAEVSLQAYDMNVISDHTFAESLNTSQDRLRAHIGALRSLMQPVG